MPHSRKHLKLTGDTHPPEVEADDGLPEQPDDGLVRYQPRTTEHDYAPVMHGIDFTLLKGSPANVMRVSPVKAMLVALAVGFVVAKLVKKDS